MKSKMEPWPRQQYIEQGLAKGLPQRRLEQWLATAHRLQAADLPPLLTLGHLASEVGVPHPLMREWVVRARENQYRTFYVAKRRGGYRRISVPEPLLMAVQRWLTQNVLSRVRANPAAKAYQRGSSPKTAAAVHLGCRWLIKIDLESFFESVSERQVFRVFSQLGFPRLLSFELARICTTLSVEEDEPKKTSSRYRHRRWLSHSQGRHRHLRHHLVGHLPQGAPTSPQLANLVMGSADQEITALATACGCRYTRYADDIAFSTITPAFSRDDAVSLIRKTRRILVRYGFRTNTTKLSVCPPGARKVVLGLLVDRHVLHLNRAFRDRLEQNVYGVSKFGPQNHAQARGFSSVLALRNHIGGLIAHAESIDADFAAEIRTQLAAVQWPL